jgi:hypothetical protein
MMYRHVVRVIATPERKYAVGLAASYVSSSRERRRGRLRGRNVKAPQYAAEEGTFVCDCPCNRRWSACVNYALMWFGGMACSRGIAWAESVARQRPKLLPRTWPAHEGRAAERARRKVANLFEDMRVIDLLAVDVSKHAARTWGQLQAQERSGS